MPIEIVLALILVSVFVIGTRFDINVGIVALVAAFLVGTFMLDMSPRDIRAGFPSQLFITMFGITLLMSITKVNGAVDWLVGKLVKLTGGKMAALPWLLFVIGFVVSTFGTAAAPMLFVVGLGFAARYKISPLFLGAFALHGNQSGAFSPIAPFGLYFQALSSGERVPAELQFAISPWGLYTQVALAHFVLAAVLFFAFGGHKLLGRRISGELIEQTLKDAGPLNVERGASLFGFIALLVGSYLGAPIGFLAVTISFLILLLSSPSSRRESLSHVPWFMILIIVGILMLVNVLQQAELFQWIANAALSIGTPEGIALVFIYLSAAITAFSSTFATFGFLVPMTAPLVVDGGLEGTSLLSSIAFSAAVTDFSPFSPWGAMFLGYAMQFDKQQLLKDMLRYALTLIATIPVISWLLLVMLPSLW